MSRRSFNEKDEYWFSPIHQKYKEKIGEIYLDELISLDPLERLYTMGWITAHHKLISIEDLWNILPNDLWPIAFLKTNGRLDILELKDIKGKQIELFPFDFNGSLNRGEIITFLNSNLYKKDYDGYLLKWRGNDVIIGSDLSDYFIRSYGFEATEIGIKAVDICGFSIDRSHYVSSVKFNHPPWKCDPPLIQFVLSPKKTPSKSINFMDLLESAIQNPRSLSDLELHLLSENPVKGIDIKFVNFFEPFDKLFGYGRRILNIRHPVSQELFRIFCLINTDNILPRDEMGRLRDLMDDFLIDELTSIENLNEKLNDIFISIKKNRILNSSPSGTLRLESKDFVPGTYPGNTYKDSFFRNEDKKNYTYFGDTL